MLSRDCDGCSQLKACKKRYTKVAKGGKVYCPDGTAHLKTIIEYAEEAVDTETMEKVKEKAIELLLKE